VVSGTIRRRKEKKDGKTTNRSVPEPNRPLRWFVLSLVSALLHLPPDADARVWDMDAPSAPSGTGPVSYDEQTLRRGLFVGQRDDDAGLVEAVARGDRAALARLYDRFAPAMLALGQRILGFGGRGGDVEDLLHNVFIEVWTKARDYDPSRSSVRTWLLLRLRSRALDRLREAGQERAVPLERWHREQVAAAAVDPALGPDGAALRRALVELPAEQRAVLELGYFQGLTTNEIADRTAAPPGTVKSRTAAALSKLRASLKAGGKDPR
jgi:RNA polymerase sigma-70 factor (ECF subfamily)